MSNLQVEELIFRQLKKSLSAEEEKILREWYNESDTNKKLYADYCVLFKSCEIEAAKPFFEKRKEHAWKHFLTQLQKKQQKRWSIVWRVSSYAAMIAIIFSIGMWTAWTFNSKPEEQLLQSIEVALGAKSRIVLPDGSVVWLNSGSKLSYRDGFGRNNRTLTLDGEGCFDVTKNKELPFEVHSGNVKIRVLGTKFNMKSYSEDEDTKVTLIEGSLNVSTDSDTSTGKTIAPNQQAVINKLSKKLTIKSVNACNYALWTEAKKEEVVAKTATRDKKLPTMVAPTVTLRNILFFDEEPLNQIIRDLERAFNVTIELKEESLGAVKFYADFRNDETIYDILKIITMNNDLKYEVKDNKIIISK